MTTFVWLNELQMQKRVRQASSSCYHHECFLVPDHADNSFTFGTIVCY